MFLLSTDAYVEQGDADAPPRPRGQRPDFGSLPPLGPTPNEEQKSLIVIDRNTARVLGFRPWANRRYEMDVLKGRRHNLDYIRLYDDISAEYSYAMGMEQDYLRGVFRIQRIDGEPCLVYDGGEFDGQKVKLDNEGRAIRKPVLRVRSVGQSGTRIKKRKNSKRMKKVRK
jgi:hypothetical protein